MNTQGELVIVKSKCGAIYEGELVGRVKEGRKCFIKLKNVKYKNVHYNTALLPVTTNRIIK